jgi:hypothetical protein
VVGDFQLAEEAAVTLDELLRIHRAGHRASLRDRGRPAPSAP